MSESKYYSVSDIALNLNIKKNQVFYAIRKINAESPENQLEKILIENRHLYSEDSYIRIKSYFDDASHTPRKNATTSDSNSTDYDSIIALKNEQIMILKDEIEVLKSDVAFYKSKFEDVSSRNDKIIDAILVSNQPKQIESTTETTKKGLFSRIFNR